MYSFGIISIELFILYSITRSLTQSMYITLFIISNSRPFSISCLSILFFPGTVIHELSHLFTAEILGVRTAGLTLVPEGIENTNVRTGSVSIAHSDPLRRALIGIAPVFVGLAVLSFISYYIPILWYGSPLVLLLACYSVFAVSNSMFSSHEDMEGFWPVAITLLLLILAGYFIGIRFQLPDTWQLKLFFIGTSLARYLGYVVILNIILYALSTLTNKLLEKITGKRFVRK